MLILVVLLTMGSRVQQTFAQSAQTLEIQISDDGFDPQEVTIDAGTTVTWTNSSSGLESVAADDGSFDSFRLDPGEQFSFVFDAEGRFDYSSTFGSGAVGTVIVHDVDFGPSEDLEAGDELQSDDLLHAAQQGGLPAAIVAGACNGGGAEVAALNPASLPIGPAIGSSSAVPGANSFTTLALSMDALSADDHAVIFTGPNGDVVACGEIGGRLTDTGSLIVGLHQGTDSDLSGVVVFSPADPPTQTNVSLFVVGSQLGGTTSTISATANPLEPLMTPETSSEAGAQAPDMEVVDQEATSAVSASADVSANYLCDDFSTTSSMEVWADLLPVFQAVLDDDPVELAERFDSNGNGIACDDVSNFPGDIDAGSGSSMTDTTETAEPPASITETAVLAYDVAAEELIDAPNGRTRIVGRIMIPEGGTPEVLAATMANAARQGLQDYPGAIVSAVFAYRPEDNTESSFTLGRSSVSRDGEGLDPDSDQLLIGPDDGRIQVEVATEVLLDVVIETEVFYFPAD